MNKRIETMDKEWIAIRQKMRLERPIFDDEYRKKHKGHECKTKVYAWNGKWFCKHLTMARSRRFKDLIDKEEGIISSIISLDKRNTYIYQ